MKAWFLYPNDERRGYVVHAESAGKAKSLVHNQVPFEFDDWTSIRAERCKKLDNQPITIRNMFEAGFDMTFEGEAIDTLDIPCPCDICQLERSKKNPTYIVCMECEGEGEVDDYTRECPECNGSGMVVRQSQRAV